MKKKKVLFIVLPYVVNQVDVTEPKLRSFLAFPYGVLSIATVCKELADFRIIDCDAYVDYRQVIMDAVDDFKPDIVGFSMMFDRSYEHLEDLTKFVGDLKDDLYIVVGGAAASYAYKEILNNCLRVDAVCVSEGEIPFYALLSEMQNNNSYGYFLNPAWMTIGRVWAYFKPQMQLIEDLNRVISLDYSLIDINNYNMQEAFSPYARSNRKCFFLLTSRGCFGKCAFCSNAHLHGRKVRQASVDAIMNHVTELVHIHGMETLIIYDDQLLYKPKRAKKLFKRLARLNIRIEAPNGVSVRYIDQEMADLMRAAGMDTVYLAIESGSPYVLKHVINKPLKLEMVEPAVTALRNADFFIHAFIVLGMPGEMDEHRRETFNFLISHDFDWAGINLATPVRGSKLYQDCIDNGWIMDNGIGSIPDKEYIIDIQLKPFKNDPESIKKQAHDMNINVNFRHNRRIRMGDYETAAACFRQVLARYENHDIAKQYLAYCEKKISK